MSYKVIDLFCGAGGFSEGILQAGIEFDEKFHIVFSNDINSDVGLTYMNRHEQLGLVQGVNTHFEQADISNIDIDLIYDRIRSLERFNEIFPDNEITIDAIFGGPPCQGFSLAGTRNHDDPRNLLFREYLRLVQEINPKYVVVENVEGFMNTTLHDFIGVSNEEYTHELLPNILISEFNLLGYNTLEPRLLNAAQFGVPQSRRRAIFIAYRNDVIQPQYPDPIFNDNFYTLGNAIGDLLNNNAEISEYQRQSRIGRTPHFETNNPINATDTLKNLELSNHYAYIEERFDLYKEGESTLEIRQRLLNNGIKFNKNKHAHIIENIRKKANKKYSMNLTTEDIINIYQKPLKNIENMESEDLCNFLLTRKNNRKKLRIDNPSPTVLTLPDDFISPFENRIFSVREMARLQSFDDSFTFLGKRTTGGARRRIDVPQYSQVGNAVPPLLAKAIAKEILRSLNTL